MKKEPETPEEKKAREVAEKAAEAQRKAEAAAQKVREDKLAKKLALIKLREEAQKSIDAIDRRYHGSAGQHTLAETQKINAARATIRDCNEKIAKIDKELGD